jgi:hypothetical protein
MAVVSVVDGLTVESVFRKLFGVDVVQTGAVRTARRRCNRPQAEGEDSSMGLGIGIASGVDGWKVAQRAEPLETPTRGSRRSDGEQSAARRRRPHPVEGDGTPIASTRFHLCIDRARPDVQ